MIRAYFSDLFVTSGFFMSILVTYLLWRVRSQKEDRI